MAEPHLRACGGCEVVDDGPRVVVGRINLPPGTAPIPDWHPDCWDRHRAAHTTEKENDHG